MEVRSRPKLVQLAHAAHPCAIPNNALNEINITHWPAILPQEKASPCFGNEQPSSRTVLIYLRARVLPTTLNAFRAHVICSAVARTNLADKRRCWHGGGEHVPQCMAVPSQVALAGMCVPPLNTNWQRTLTHLITARWHLGTRALEHLGE